MFSNCQKKIRPILYITVKYIGNIQYWPKYVVFLQSRAMSDGIAIELVDALNLRQHIKQHIKHLYWKTQVDIASYQNSMGLWYTI